SRSWSAPAAFPTSPAINTTNTSCTNDNGFIIGTLAAGYTLYFESSRNELAGTTCRRDGKHRLYMITYTPGSGFSGLQKDPVLDGGLTNEDDTQISVTQDRSTVFFTRATNAAYGVFTATWDGSAYANVQQIVQPNFASPFTGKLQLIGEANMAETASGYL